jgi:hypothetical protein
MVYFTSELRFFIISSMLLVGEKTCENTRKRGSINIWTECTLSFLAVCGEFEKQIQFNIAPGDASKIVKSLFSWCVFGASMAHLNAVKSIFVCFFDSLVENGQNLIFRLHIFEPLAYNVLNLKCSQSEVMKICLPFFHMFSCDEGDFFFIFSLRIKEIVLIFPSFCVV